MKIIELECPQCSWTANVTKDNNTCRCGYVFPISDPSIFDRKTSTPPPELYKDILITTETVLDGYVITKRIDVLGSEYVSGINVFREDFLRATDFFGGRSETLQNEFIKMRRSCLDDLRRQASSLGANAIIGIDFQYANLSREAFMMLVAATGTAVVVEKANVSVSKAAPHK